MPGMPAGINEIPGVGVLAIEVANSGQENAQPSRSSRCSRHGSDKRFLHADTVFACQ